MFHSRKDNRRELREGRRENCTEREKHRYWEKVMQPRNYERHRKRRELYYILDTALQHQDTTGQDW